MPSAWELLADNGPLAQAVPQFQAREAQQDMAQCVADALENQATAVVEAGTGVGKTFAYVLPALRSEGYILISTGTKTLQDQLYYKDIPLVKEALQSGARVALLKGRSNYLCLQRLETAYDQGEFNDRRAFRWLRRIEDWALITETGDISELDGIPRHAEVWSRVTSTVDNCLGQHCEHYGECHLVNARRDAQEADVVVVNHHLFFADIALKDRGFGELLPEASAVILDEAHQLPEIASIFFSQSFSSRQVFNLCSDLKVEMLELGNDMPKLETRLDQIEKTVKDFRLALDKPGLRMAWYKVNRNRDVRNSMNQLARYFSRLERLLQAVQERSKGLKQAYKRLQELGKRLDYFRTVKVEEGDLTVQPVSANASKKPEASDESKDADATTATAAETETSAEILWFETYTRSFTLHATPLNIARLFKRQIDSSPCAWILTSATLSVNDSFVHFTRQLGIEESVQQQLASPFDYWHNTVMYAPSNLPEPSSSMYTNSVVEAAIPVIEAAGGRTFMLFTSYRALNEAADLLRDTLEYPLFVQGEHPQRDMIERFREAGNAVLLGTASFWEGVDVRGEALSCVIIDKLPFAAPNDPVMEAQLQQIRERGGNPFMDYQLPQAVIALKQGVGRLIRDVNDRGVLVICDPRLRTKMYGRVFLNSLPRMPRTQKLEVVQRFFNQAQENKE